MKRKITFLSAALMLLAFLAVPLGMWGQTRTEEVYSTCLFGPNYNSQGVSSYTATFIATNGDFSWTIANGNNNNNQWNYVKFGRKNNASVGSITTTVNYGQAITKVDLTIDAITADKVNSITLYTSSDNNTWVEASSFGKATGVQTATLATPATGLYYKIELDCASGSANGLVTVSKVEYYYNSDGPSTPTITASNIELAYDATEGAIAYTINNPVDNGSIAASTESGWLMVDDQPQSNTNGTFMLLCDPNTGDARMATVTLTYTYGEESITKDVTITQAAAPVVYTTIPDLFAAATSTETSVLVNFNSWVVSGVSTNGKNVFVTDNEGNGFVIYSSSNMSNIYSVGNILSGEISCSLKLYNGFAELLNVNAEDLTITEGGTLTEAAIEMADLAGVNTGALLHYDNLTCSVSNNKYYLTDGTTTLQVYNALFAFEAFTDGASYNITGIYQQFNNTKEILPRSAEDIEEVISSVATPTFNPVAGTYSEAQTVTISCETQNVTIYYTTNGEDPDDESTQYTEPILVSETTTIKAIAYDNEDNTSAIASATYTIEQPLTTMEQIFNAATSTATSHFITFGDEWVISGASSRRAYVTDGFYGFVIYDGNNSLTFEAGQVLHGTVECQLMLSHGAAQVSGINASSFTNITSGEVFVNNWVSISELQPINTGAVFNLGQLTFNGSKFVDADDNEITPYNGLYSYEPFTQGSVYSVTGVYTYYDLNEILPRDANDIVEYVAPVLTVSPDMVTVPYTGGTGDFTVTPENINNPFGGYVTFYDPANPANVLDEDPTWIFISHDFSDFSLSYSITEANTSYEARTACFKFVVMCNGGPAVSNLVTVTQNGKPLPTVAVEPYVTELETPDYAEGSLAIVAENLDINAAQINYYELVENEFVLVEEAPAWLTLQVDQTSYETINYYVEANTGDARTAYFKLGLQSYPDMQYYYSEMVTISQAAYVTPEPPTTGWVLTDLADLTADDIFVIVGDNGDTYAMSNNNGTSAAPAAIEVAISNDGTYLTGNIADTIKWNISGNADDGYIFYPNGDTENWLYCTATNNGVRVGTNTNNTFSLSDEGYLYNNATNRYVGIYNSTDWRCYTSINSNIVDQTFAFYKKVGGEPQPSITVNPDLVNAPATETEGTLEVTYVNIATSAGVELHWFEDADATIALNAAPSWIEADINSDLDVDYIIDANDGEARTAYFKVYGVDADANDVFSNLVTINQEAYVAPVEAWVLTNLANLTEGDVFVIVGDNEDTYAMPYDGGGQSGAPAAVAVTVINNALSEAPAANIQWNISRQGNSYTFYPNGDTENWLYCTNSNNGVRVGTNANNAFVLESGYLKNVATNRYVGIYNSQDWRCYTNTTGNIANQTFAFYKKVVPTESYTLHVNGYDTSETDGYVLLASPVYVKPETTGMTEGTYDLYYFDQSIVGYEWRNFEVEEGQFNLIPGKGYLYANSDDVDLSFEGVPYNGDGEIALNYTEGAIWAGWNLVGNPFGVQAEISNEYYIMNEEGNDIIAGESYIVEPMQGVFVVAENNESTVIFDNNISTPNSGNSLSVNLSQNRGAVIDRTIVRFGEGRQLPKFQLNAESTKLYIPQGNNDYAVVRSATSGEMPVNFKAQNNGSYTLSVDAENVEVSYLHLIDNMTGADVDLLATPSYSFEATTSDYASRFRLVFNVTGVEENANSTEPFAFFNGSVWCISNTGEATLQVVDMLGRIVSSKTVNGNATIATDNLTDGVYVMRLLNGNDVKTQKIVVR